MNELADIIIAKLEVKQQQWDEEFHSSINDIHGDVPLSDILSRYAAIVESLRKHGIKVVLGILRKPCEQLNEVFSKYIRTKMPFVILKSAVSLDGKIATRSGDSRWITGVKAREQVHRLRNQVDAIMVGAGTVVKDNPRLTTRMKNRKGKNPIRIIEKKPLGRYQRVSIG